MTRLIILVCGMLAALPITASAQSFTLSDASFEVAVNSASMKTKTVTANFSADLPADAKIEWAGHEGFLSLSQTRTDNRTITTTFTAVKPVTNQTITATFAGQSATISATVKPELSNKTVVPQLRTTEKATGVSIVRGGERDIALRLIGTTAAPGSLSAQSSTANATVQLVGLNLKVTAVTEGNAVVTLSGNGDSIGNFTVTVTPAIDIAAFPSEIVITRDVADKVALGPKLNNADLTKLEISQPASPTVAEIVKNELISKGPGKTSFTVKVKDTTLSKDIAVIVEPKAQDIVLVGLNPNESLRKGRNKEITAKIRGEGKDIEGDITLASGNEDCVFVDDLGGNKFVLKAGDENCDSTIITATATVNGKTLSQRFSISPKTVIGFKPLKIRLDMLDGQTARDLFGKKSTDEYFIAKIRLFNNIKESESQNADSILVYSESLEVKVAVEWRVSGSKGKVPVWTTIYNPVTRQYVKAQAVDAAGATLFVDASEWQTLDEQTARAWFPGAQLTAAPDPKSPCKAIKQENMFVPYRPLTFEMVSNTQERRNNRSWRSRLLTAIYGLTSMTSFITTVAVPKSSNDLKPGLDNFRNLIIPNFEKLFPSHNELERQNITSMVMRPLEEIPFGSDITRIVFFPKRKISGVLSNQPNARKTELRISAVSISDACADVGIITKVRNNGNDEDNVPQP